MVDTFFERDLQLAEDALRFQKPALADRLLSALEETAYHDRNVERLYKLWPQLARARRMRRQKASRRRIDLHTHTTASDGEMSVDYLLRRHFVSGQILISDHNSIDSLAEARRIVREYDLELDVLLGNEVICTHQMRAFECNVIAPRLSDEFVNLCREHRKRWDRVCELFVRDLAEHDDFFEHELWQEIAIHLSVGGSWEPIVALYERTAQIIRSDFALYAKYLHGCQTGDTGTLWYAWNLASKGDPPQLPHRYFTAMFCFVMNAYREQVGDWFDYVTLMQKFREAGCFISHNHPNYWDDDFVGELTCEQQTQWLSEWADQGAIDAVEVWSPPFASKRVPDYWHRVSQELGLVAMAGTDCHDGHEQELGGTVENHPEIIPSIYSYLVNSVNVGSKNLKNPWQALEVWRNVLDIDYCNQEALSHCLSAVESLAD